MKALEAFKEGHVILIAGGHDKMTDLTEFMQVTARKTDALILWRGSPAFLKAAKKNGVKNIVMCDGSFEDAVRPSVRYGQTTSSCAPCRRPALPMICLQTSRNGGRVFKSIVHTLKKEAGEEA